MKIRLQRGSIRFRLRQGDVQALAQKGSTEEQVHLGGTDFRVTLRRQPAPAAVSWDGSGIVATVPESDARGWAASDVVGLRYVLEGGTVLLVEKDWACMELAPGETNEDTFPRPLKSQA